MVQKLLAFANCVPIQNGNTLQTKRHCNSVRVFRLSTEMNTQQSRRPSFNVIPAVAYGTYMSRLFLLPPFPHDLSKDLQEAWDLSLNFGYFIPILFPNYSPVIHPIVEGVFHVVAAWSFLLLGFASLDAYNPPSKPPIKPFILLAPFLTNIVFMPYLVLRQQPPKLNSTAGETQLPQPQQIPQRKRTRLIKLGESVFVPYISLALAAISIPWALFGRPEFGPLSTRMHTFIHLTTTTDILSYSFLVDIIMFTLFQSFLVDFDARQRQWTSQYRQKSATIVARFVPFLGLAFYLLQRARHAPLQWVKDNDDPGKSE